MKAFFELCVTLFALFAIIAALVAGSLLGFLELRAAIRKARRRHEQRRIEMRRHFDPHWPMRR